MRIKKARRLLKTLADDTRLRIVNLLSRHELNVGELRKILETSQSNLSKHLARLRHTGVVDDRRKGMNVYYYLHEPDNKTHRDLVHSVINGLSGLDVFKSDLAKIKKDIINKRKKH